MWWGAPAVDKPMIVRESDVHHRTDGDLTLDGHRAREDSVHPHDGGLWRVDDRRRQKRAKDTAVGDRESTTDHILNGKLPVLCL